MTDDLDYDAQIVSLWANVNQLAARVRHLEKMMNTRATPMYKRIWFRIDGWPSWTVVASKRAWRPWHG
jgi:hypothetical protein